MMTPHLHQEIARQRHAEALQRARHERLVAPGPETGDGLRLSLSRRLRRVALGRASVREPRVLRPAS